MDPKAQAMRSLRDTLNRRLHDLEQQNGQLKVQLLQHQRELTSLRVIQRWHHITAQCVVVQAEQRQVRTPSVCQW